MSEYYDTQIAGIPVAVTVRVQVTLDIKTTQELSKLQEELGAGTKSEVIKQGLRLLRWRMDLEKEGGQVAEQLPDGRMHPIKFL